MKFKPKKGTEVAKELWHTLLYGVSGCGKTRFAAACPKRSLILDIDHGIQSAAGMDVDFLTDDNEKGWPYWQKVLEWVLTGDHDYEEVFLDSFSALSDEVLKEVMKTNNRSVPAQKDYGDQIRILQRIIDRLTLQRRVRITVLAHETVRLNEEGQVIKYIPLVIGRKFPDDVPRFFDEVWRMIVRSKGTGAKARKERILLTQGTSMFLAESRLDLPAEVPADWNVIYGYTKGGDIDEVKGEK